MKIFNLIINNHLLRMFRLIACDLRFSCLPFGIFGNQHLLSTAARSLPHRKFRSGYLNLLLHIGYLYLTRCHLFRQNRMNIRFNRLWQVKKQETSQEYGYSSSSRTDKPVAANYSGPLQAVERLLQSLPTIGGHRNLIIAEN